MLHLLAARLHEQIREVKTRFKFVQAPSNKGVLLVRDVKGNSDRDKDLRIAN
jgi:hypothetical protein